MVSFQPTDNCLGATVEGLDLSLPVTEAAFLELIDALGRYGVLRFPDQKISATQLRDFSARFGSLQSASSFSEPGVREVSILSNVRKPGGERIGVPDAGQEWHTDMTYNRTVGFVNVLYGVQVPSRDGRPLGGTAFQNTQLASADLPDKTQTLLRGLTARHDLEKYWEQVRAAKGSERPPYSDDQRRSHPPVDHPVLLRHPITGRDVIYVNPSFTVAINELSASESDELLNMLYEHILQPKYHYLFEWTEGDVLMWDHIGTWHNAIADYGPDEPRLMKRCQVMADKIFNPAFQHFHGIGVSA